MRPLDLKLLRDLRTMKGQMLAISLVMACGLTMMIMARGLIVSLETERDRYYAENRFADVFSDLVRAPNSLRSRLMEISGAGTVETRVTGHAILDIPGMDDIAEAILVSIPDERPQQLNILHILQGRLPEHAGRNEIVISKAFADAHGFRPGDTIQATMYGNREELYISGTAMSPEFVYELPPGAFVPDNKRYGVFWMNERELANAFNMDGAFNNVVMTLAPGGNVEAVKAEMDRILRPYGGQISYDRSEQASAQWVETEIEGLRAFALAFPIIFLSVAAFMTSAALTRLVRLQREQIAQLKAFGYSSTAIGIHYFKFTLAAVIAATVMGGVGGLWAGRGIVILYEPFFQFPSLTFRPDYPAVLIGLVASAGAAFLGVLNSVRQAVKLPPAEAMRPEPPAEFKPSRIEALGLQNLVSPAFRMALRNLERKPWQGLFTALGLAMATAIPIVPGAMRDGMNYMMDFQWRLAQRQDVTLGLIEPGSYASFTAMRNLPGVLHAEPFRAVSARIGHGHHERGISLSGLPQDGQLNRLLDADANQIPLPLSGVLLSEKLAEVLDVKPGGTVRLEVQEGRRPVFDIVVAGTITDFADIGAYMDIDALRRLMREGDTVSGAHLTLDSAQWAPFLASAREAPQIGAIVRTRAARESFDETMAELIVIAHTIYFGFAAVLAFGVIYNGARIALSERTRDLATLRVLGYTQREVAGVLIGELALLTLLAILPGLFIGTQLAAAILEAASTETTRFPLVLTGRTYATAVLIVLASSILSFAIVSRRIHKLDLIGVLKARE